MEENNMEENWNPFGDIDNYVVNFCNERGVDDPKKLSMEDKQALMGYHPSIGRNMVGQFYDVAHIDQVRALRSAYLEATDWTQMPDSALSAEKKAEFAKYRQELRDLPTSGEIITPDDDGWPTRPE